MSTPRERIQTLLRIHGGHCFIVNTCADYDALVVEAFRMAMEGLCVVAASQGGPAGDGMDIKRKGYRAGKMSADLAQEPAPVLPNYRLRK